MNTAPDNVDLPRARLARLGRRIFLALLVVFIALGAAGVFDVNLTSVEAVGGGYEIQVRYAKTTRPGLATPWFLEVRHAGGFDGPITIATTSEYFEHFDENGLNPDPSSVTQTDDLMIWEFEPPDGETLRVSFDARWEPGWRRPATGTTMLLVNGVSVVEVDYETKGLP